jgi:hypothetical protein
MSLPLLIIPVLLAAFLIVVLIFQALWNSTFPSLFGWKIISFWTAFKIILISTILFGGYQIPLGYGTSSTHTTKDGSTTTNWSVGSIHK